ncbi:SDR family NAD(P)-dependent oxidoreductase [Paractinoplanes atraurantiacus]|uniref:Short chain dehydrogenase n=1 Tax=Paractinoplanes atraurantiacus TaxID=1036182 RepID=A0A285IGH9_9ACTN|nr:SDR family NAD(P)-dependent oxidoreductase [Actinoplanes atraurantiacus]SNY47110.1 short chain dehydrogenase [Actinoplanes atraurantiacus]
MTTLAIVGAGEGLGAAVARRFGAEGFHVALLARRQDRLDKLGSELKGVNSRGYAADVLNAEALSWALERAANDLGPIEVLQYSPLPQRQFLKPVLETSVEEMREAVEFSIAGPMTAVNQVLPGMRQLGRGSILFVNGGSGARPNPKVGGTSIAFAGEGAYGQMLHETLSAEGVHVGQLIIPGAIEPGQTEGLAEKLWRMHSDRGEFRVFAS